MNRTGRGIADRPRVAPPAPERHPIAKVLLAVLAGTFAGAIALHLVGRILP